MRACFGFSRVDRLAFSDAAARRRLRLALILLLFGCAMATGARATSDGAAVPEIVEIEAKLQALQSGSQDDPQRAKLRDIYAATLDNLKLAAENRERDAKYQRLYEEAPAKTAGFAAELSQLQAGTRSAKSLDQTVALTRLERVLRDTEERLESLLDRESDLQDIAASLRRRSESGRAELKSVAADLASESKIAAQAGETSQLDLARQTEQQSRRALLKSIQSRLETDLRTIPQRLAAVEAELQLVSAQRAQAQRFVAELLELDSLKRIGEAERMREEIDERARSVTSAHPEVLRIADQNLRLSAEYVEAVTGLESVEEELADADSALRDLRSGLDSTRQQLEITALHDALGPVLMEHYIGLRAFERPDRKLARLSDLLARSRLRGLDLEQQLKKEPDERERIYRGIEDSTELSVAERARAVAESERLFADRHVLLTALDERYSRGIQRLLALDDTYHEQARIAEEFLNLLDHNLVWMKSHRALDLDYFRNWPREAWGLVQAQDWRGLAGALQESIRTHAPAVLFALVLVVVLARIRFRLSRRLERSSLRKVGWKNYRFDMTLEALGIHLVLAAPLPLLVLFLGWLVGADSTSPLAEAVRSACYRSGINLYAFMLIRYALAENGFARQHLRWRTARVQSVERILRIAIAVVIPAIFFTRLADQLSAQTPGDESSRLVAIALAVAIFGFALWIARASRGMFSSAFFSNSHPVLSRIATLMVVAVIAFQPVTIALDALGYHFTATSLYLRILATIYVMVCTKIVYDTGLLGITIAAQRSRAAQRSESEEGVAQTVEVVAPGKTIDPVDDFDLDRMNASAVALLNVFVLGLAVMVLILLWRQFFAALQALDHINLWSYSVTSEGQDTVEWVSLFDFLAAVLTFVVTFVLAKGLPSLLGIVFYSVITQKGVLFALQTVLRYLVGGIGTIAALQTLGFGWSKLQWMAAGLSVGVGFGMQEIFANFFSGLIMLFERPVRIGDVITLGEYSGTIQRIRMRATTITDFDNREIIVPNKMFVTERLINWTLSSSVVRISFDVGISYSADPRLAHRTLLQILKEERRILRDPEPVVIFREFGDSSLNFRCFCHVEDVSVRLQVQNDLHMRITEVFREKGIEIAYPQMDLHLRSVDEQARLRT